jgi:hypothetical protein
MATGITLTSTGNLSSGQKILIAAAKLAYEPSAVDPDLIESDSLAPGEKSRNILTYARLASAVQLTEAVDVSQVQQLVAATLPIDPSEHGLILTMSKRLLRRQLDLSLISGSGKMLAGSVRRRQALDVIALYDSFTKSIVGAGSTLDITYFSGAISYLRTDNDTAYGPAPMPLHAALHAEQIRDIVTDISDVSPRGTTTGFTDEVLRNWFRGRDRLYGISIWESGNMTRDASDDAKGAIFSKEAMIIVMEDAWEPTEEVDNSVRLREFGLFGSWGEALRADPHGVEIYSDAAAIT